MKNEIFNPQDFDYSFSYNDTERNHNKINLANMANAKLNSWLKENGKVVYTEFQNGFDNSTKSWVTYQTSGDTHKALLICIETIERCKHEPEKVKLITVTSHMLEKITLFQCECGAKVKPASFMEET